MMIELENHLRNIRTEPGILSAQLDDLEKEFTKLEPRIQAFIPETGRFARIRKNADVLETQYPGISDRPPLYGLLVGVKDIFHVDGLPTRAGSKLPLNELIGEEAAVVTKLKQNGALILGKTVTTEFAYFAPGPTRNPHNPDHTPGGSSSGSAAAVAAGLIPFALGTQTIGSIIRPASYCGVVGFKPSYGRIPTKGVIPLAPSVDTIGFFTANPISALYLGRVILEGWESPQSTTRKPVLGIPEGPYLDYVDSEMKSFFNNTTRALRSSGYSIKAVQSIADFARIYERHNQLVAYEAAKTHERWFSQFRQLYHSKTAELIERGLKITAEEYKDALNNRAMVREELASLQKQYGIDLWLSPPAKGAAPRGLESTGDPVMNLPWTHSGVPVLNLPAGRTKSGLPMGLQISAGFNQDEQLLQWSVVIALDLQTVIQR